MATTTFSNLRVYKELTINEKHNDDEIGFKLTPSNVTNRSSDITGYVLKAKTSDGKAFWSPGITQTYNLSDLIDTALPTQIVNNSVLTYNESTSNWISTPKITKLTQLSDVDISGLTDNSILVYNSEIQEFQIGSMPTQIQVGGQEGSVQIKDANGNLEGVNDILWNSADKELTFTSASKINLGGLSITDANIVGLSSSPLSGTSAVSRDYLQTELANVLSGLVWKEMVEYATTETDDYSGSMDALTTTGSVLVIDSIDTFMVGDRILFKNNASLATSNGIYIITDVDHPNYTIARSPDMASSSLAAGSVMWVDEGATNEGYAFICNSASGLDTVDTHQLTFVEFNANTSDALEAGQGLSKAFNALSLSFNSANLNVINDNKLDLNDSGVVGGSYGSSLVVPNFSVNEKGIITSASSTPIQFASTSTDGILTKTDYDSFNSRMDASTLSDGYIWIGSNGAGATQRTISGDIVITSDGNASLKNVSPGLPIVPFPNAYTNSSVKIPRLSVNAKGIVTTLTDFQIPTSTANQTGLLSSIDWTKFNNKLSASLNSGQMFVGSGSGNAISKTITGDVTVDDNGVFTLKTTTTAGTVGNSLTIPRITFDEKGRITSTTSDAIPIATATTSGILTAADHVSFTDKMPNTLASGKLFIGNDSNKATATSFTGDISISNTGLTTIASIHETAPTVNYSSGFTFPKVSINKKGLVTELTGQTIPIVSSSNPGILTSTDYTSFINKLNKSDFISDGKILVGDGTNAKSVPISGDISMDNTGNVSILPTIPGNKILPGNVHFTCASGDTSTGHADTNVKINGSLGVTGKTYFNGPVSSGHVQTAKITVGSSVFESGRITHLNDPLSETDAVNKKYVDDATLGIKWVDPVMMATTTNIVSLSSLDPYSNSGKIDNVQLTNNSRILVKNQTDKTKNGIYIIKATEWVRAEDMTDTADAANIATFVKSGDINGSSSYAVTGTQNIIGTDEINFTLFSKSTSVMAGNGLSGITKLNVKTDNSTIILDPTTGSVRMKEVTSISGMYGSETSIPIVTTDKYGRVIAITNTPMQTASYTDQNTKRKGIISGDDYNLFKNKIDSSLLKQNGKILVGTTSGPQSVTMSGDATLSSTGVLSLNAIHENIPTVVNTGITVPDITIDSQGRVTSLGTSTINYASVSGSGLLSSSDYNNFKSKMDANILVSDGHVLIGDGTTRNSVPISGDISIDNTGLVTIADTITGNKTISGGALTVDELIVTQPDGIIAPKTTSNDIVFIDSITTEDGSITVGSTIISNGRIQGVLTPTAGTDAANRDYVDQSSSGIKWQPPVATRAGINVQVVEPYHITDNPDGPTLTTGADSTPVGGYNVSVNDRILIDSQNDDTFNNGIYYVETTTAGGSNVHLKRVSDFSDGVNVSGYAVYVENGTYDGLSYVVSSTPAVINTDNILFSTFAGSSSFTAGVGTSKIINSLNVNYDDETIGIQNNALYIKNNSIIASKLADSSVTALKLANSSVTTSKVLDGSITGVKLAASSIVNATISNSANISPSKLSVSTWSLDSNSDIALSGTILSGKVGLGEKAKLTINPSKVVKTSDNQTIGGIKTFAGNMKITSEIERIKGTTAALVVSGGAIVKKNFEAKNVFTGNMYIDTSATINSITFASDSSIADVSTFSAISGSFSDSLVIDTLNITDNEIHNVNKIVGLLAPTGDSQAANKRYVDDSVNQFKINRSSVKCMTSGQLGQPLSGSYSTTLTNGVTLLTGDRILVKDQNTIENGLYVVNTSGAWSRTTDYPAGSRADGLTVYVENAKLYMICTNINAVVHSAVLVFSPLISPGDGLVSNGNVLSIALEDSSLEFNNGKLKVKQIANSNLENANINVTSGNGISLTDVNNVISTSVHLGGAIKVSVKLATNSGLETTTNGLSLKTVPNTKLENSTISINTTQSKGIIIKNGSNNEISMINLGDSIIPEIKLASNSGLSVSNAGLAVNLPDDFIQDSKIISLSGDKIASTSIQNASLVNDKTTFNVSSGSGIELSSDNGSTYETNGSVDVPLGSGLNVKLSNTITRNDTSDDITAQKRFTNTTASTSKTSGAVVVTGGIGVGGDVYSNSIHVNSGTFNGITIASGGINGITNVINPTDAVSKNYVDNLTFGIIWTQPVKYATTEEIGIIANDYTGIGATLTVDGNSTWYVGDRILVKDEVNKSENGIYAINSESAGVVTLARASDMLDTVGSKGITMLVSGHGTINANTGYTCTNDSPLEFVKFTSSDVTDSGNGLSKIGNIMNVVPADTTIVSDNTGIRVGAIPVDLLDDSTISIIAGNGLSVIHKESDNDTIRSDNVSLGGFVHISLDPTVIKGDTVATFTDTTQSTTTATGSVIISGGLGVAKTVNADSVNASMITDGTATLSSGALSGITTADFSDNLTLSKGSAQGITSVNDLSIASTNGFVDIESVIFSNSVVSNISNITMSGNLSIGSVVLNSSGLSGLSTISVTSDPVMNNDVTRKLYVDNQITNAITGHSVKTPVHLASSSDISGNIFSGTSITGFDGTLVVGNRVLIKNQTDKTYNGIYIVKTDTWTRAADFNPGKVGDMITVISGTNNKHKTYICTSTTSGYTFEILNKAGAGLTSDFQIDFDNTTLDLNNTTNKLQVKSITPSLITDTDVKFIYGNGIKSSGIPKLGSNTNIPTLSVDYDDTTIGVDTDNKLTIKNVDIGLLSSSIVTLQNTDSIQFTSPSVQLGNALSANVMLAPDSGLLISAFGLQIDTDTITDKLSMIKSNQIQSLDASKLTGTVQTSSLSSNTISLAAGRGVQIKNTSGESVTNVPLGGQITISADTIDKTAANTFSNIITFSKNTESSNKGSGAVVISNGGLGVRSNINAGGRIESETSIKVGNVIVSDGILTGLNNPVNNSDAATKSYVDNAVNGSKWKTPVRCATVSKINNFSTLTDTGVTNNAIPHSYDGVVVALNDRILVKNQDNKTENGIYYVSQYVASGNLYQIKLSRDHDMSTGSYAAGAAVFVTEGEINAKSGFVCNNEYTTSIIGTNQITWTQISASTNYTVNDGIMLEGSEFNIKADTDQFEFVGNFLTIKTDGIGSNEIANDSIIASKIPDHSIPNSKLASDGTFTFTTGKGIEIKKDQDTSYTNTITPGLGSEIHIKVKDNVILSDAESQTLSGAVTLSGTTPSTSTSSGTLVVAGGMGVQGAINATSIASETITSMTITDGTLSMSSGAVSGITTMDVSDDITLSKGSTQTITSTSDLSITSTSGNVAINSVAVTTTGAVSGITTMDVSDDITLSKGSTQTITSTGDLSINSTSGNVAINSVAVSTTGAVSGITTMKVRESVTVGDTSGSKVTVSVQEGGGNSEINFKLPNQQGPIGSVLSNNGTGVLSWVSNNVLYKRTVIDNSNYGTNVSMYNVNMTDDIIAVRYTITGPVNIQLPSISVSGHRRFTIVDEGGNANINNIFIHPNGSDKLIGKTTPLVINGAYNSFQIYNDGLSNWFIA